MAEKQKINGITYWKNSAGQLVPEEMIRPYEQLKDGVVVSIGKKIDEMRKIMEQTKREAMEEIDTFMDLAAEEYNVNIGGDKGNITLTSYDGNLKIVIANSTSQEFNEKINFAKALIDEYLTELTKDSAVELKTIISSTFRIRQGKMDVKRILELRNYDIKNDKWIKAMALINESLEIITSNRCFRLYIKNPKGKGYDRLNMDFATVG